MPSGTAMSIARPTLQKEAVYGLTELKRTEIAPARLVANPGCYPTSAQLPLIPLIEGEQIVADDIIIDAKSGVSGAGRDAKLGSLYAEVTEGIHAYGVAGHRHAPEIEQELSEAAGKPIVVNFTPHLMPMSRGILSSIYVRLQNGATVEDLRQTLESPLQGRAVRAAAAGRAVAADAPCARLQPLPDRRLRRPRARARDPAVGDRQPGEGRLGPGGAEHEPDGRPAGDRRRWSRSRCSRERPDPAVPRISSRRSPPAPSSRRRRW